MFNLRRLGAEQSTNMGALLLRRWITTCKELRLSRTNGSCGLAARIPPPPPFLHARRCFPD
jgi:hypothetical protein